MLTNAKSDKRWCKLEGLNSEADEIVHVYPLFGREHVMSIECWCHPEIDEECDNVVVHNVEN